MSNLYHVLYAMPSHDGKTLSSSLEMLAQQLVQSGRLRINADNARNFITYSGSGFDKTFSKRELIDPRLLPETKQTVANTLPPAAGAKGLADTYERLLRDLKRAGDIPAEKELAIARLLVQAAHPAVMLLCLLERVDIFVSYSHNVADLMAMHFWDSQGRNSGMQSISGDGTAVYVSCGGDPFITDEAHKTYTTDGFDALARLMVIAAQEFAHFADLRRNSQGQMVGRYSASLSPLAPSAVARSARNADMATLRQAYIIARHWHIEQLARLEETRSFYRKRRRFSLLRAWYELRCLTEQGWIRYFAARRNVTLIRSFPSHSFGMHGWATRFMACLGDMAFNLAPDADVYRRSDAQEEEAIACIEALARVPQQAIKWGEATTRACWPALSALYYQHVVPGNIAAYETLSGKRYHFPAE